MDESALKWSHAFALCASKQLLNSYSPDCCCEDVDPWQTDMAASSSKAKIVALVCAIIVLVFSTSPTSSTLPRLLLLLLRFLLSFCALIVLSNCVSRLLDDDL